MVAVQIEKRASGWLHLLLVGGILAFILFVLLYVRLGDWRAGVFALVTLLGVVRLLYVRIRLALDRRQTPAPVHGHAVGAGSASPGVSAVAPLGSNQGAPAAFVSSARHTVGGRYREGFVAITPQAAAFVATGTWRYLAVELVLALVGTRLPLTRIRLAAVDSALLEAELAALVRQNGGFVLDAGWLWVTPKWLKRAQGSDILAIAQRLPGPLSVLWPDAPPSAPAKLRRLRLKILAIGGAVTAALAGAGVGAWRLTGTIDYLTAGLCFAGLIAFSVIMGVILSARVKAEKPRSPV